MGRPLCVRAAARPGRPRAKPASAAPPHLSSAPPSDLRRSRCNAPRLIDAVPRLTVPRAIPTPLGARTLHPHPPHRTRSFIAPQHPPYSFETACRLSGARLIHSAPLSLSSSPPFSTRKGLPPAPCVLATAAPQAAMPYVLPAPLPMCRRAPRAKRTSPPGLARRGSITPPIPI